MTMYTRTLLVACGKAQFHQVKVDSPLDSVIALGGARR